MSTDAGRWKNCKKCGRRYSDTLRQCPGCGHKPILGYISGTVAFGIVTASLIGSVFLIYASVSPALPTNNDSKLNDVGATDGIEFYYEARTDVLLNRGAFLKENDVVTFDLRIPDKNVTTMDGVFSVQSMAYFDIEFRNSTGALYCDQCKIRVYDDQSGRDLTDNV